MSARVELTLAVTRPRSVVSPPSDEELTRRLVAGDPWAKEALYRKHFPAVWKTALRLLERRADAEDLVQDAFLTIFEEIGALRDPSALGPWLLRVTVRQAHRRFRRRKLMRAIGLDRGADDATLDQLASPTVDPEARDMLRRLDFELRRLPSHQRVAWVLRRVEGYSVEEVADACSVSPATAKRWIRSAHQQILPHVDIEESDES